MNTGKNLAALKHEIEVERLALSPSNLFDDTCICWQDDGTLAFFGSDGFPAFYWTEGRGLDRDDFTNYERFLDALVSQYANQEKIYLLLTGDDWITLDPKDIGGGNAVKDLNEVKSFNNLLGDVAIDLE